MQASTKNSDFFDNLKKYWHYEKNKYIKNSPKYTNNMNIPKKTIGITMLLTCGCGLIGLVMWGFPKYEVWYAELEGKAEFVKAEQNRKIKIEEAKANLEAEKLNAQAEIERAKGAAEAIRIENGAISPTYIQYLWVRQQQNLNDKTVIYIPTETNLPVLEAGRTAAKQ